LMKHAQVLSACRVSISSQSSWIELERKVMEVRVSIFPLVLNSPNRFFIKLILSTSDRCDEEAGRRHNSVGRRLTLSRWVNFSICSSPFRLPCKQTWGENFLALQSHTMWILLNHLAKNTQRACRCCAMYFCFEILKTRYWRSNWFLFSAELWVWGFSFVKLFELV
jgi:hypothetical protein